MIIGWIFFCLHTGIPQRPSFVSHHTPNHSKFMQGLHCDLDKFIRNLRLSRFCSVILTVDFCNGSCGLRGLRSSCWSFLRYGPCGSSYLLGLCWWIWGVLWPACRCYLLIFAWAWVGGFGVCFDPLAAVRDVPFAGTFLFSDFFVTARTGAVNFANLWEVNFSICEVQFDFSCYVFF